jgi:hypothetical protein
MADYKEIKIKGPLGKRELDALAKNLTPLVEEADIQYFQYEPTEDCFFFNASTAAQRRDWRAGYCLSVADAEAGDWKTIYEPANF